MRGARSVADRFLAMIDTRLVPALSPHGFERRRAVLERDLGELRWLVEVDLAPWTNPEKICFTLTWGVAVPGLGAVLDDASSSTPARVASCPVRGGLREGGSGVETTWFTVGPVHPLVRGFGVAAELLDARTSVALRRAIDAQVLPALRALDSIPSVQAHLVDGLVRGRGAAGETELQRIRAIAGLSLLLGERANASRWLDYLEVRSSAAIAPDVVAERLAALRQRCAS